eukprot:TRINITY_DN1024_c0_g1_i9.p1 TRINITY_DN1024_c0_g1~~TRINITY_DN1024_c0_g1_i9.p1  ORF type:complete len:319 (+),score=84.98 TRINITY_DN1024_c0_g1_i9:237-1193(+)
MKTNQPQGDDEPSVPIITTPVQSLCKGENSHDSDHNHKSEKQITECTEKVVQPPEIPTGIPMQENDWRVLRFEDTGSPSSIASRIPVELVWKNLTISTKSRKKLRIIINNVSGIVKSCQFLAIIGASGAGKTTLLNYLSGKMHSSSLKATGEAFVNGKSTKTFRNYLDFTAFVQQEDVLMETLTVEECLEYAAKLKFSPSARKRGQRVKELLQELELTDAKDTRFGNSNSKGRTLSRGERKRLSIAVELITNPSLLFLDEPTTSMDAFTAEKIVEIINKLRHRSRTVIATIHQPNTNIFNNFDQLMIMAGGRLIYHVS